MSQTTIVVLVQQALLVFMVISMPILIVSIVVGLVISILQATTSIQEQTLTFVPKIMAMIAVIYVLATWMLSYISGFTINIFAMLPSLAR